MIIRGGYMKKLVRILILVFALALPTFSEVELGLENKIVAEAASIQTLYSSEEEVIIGKKAQIIAPSSYKKPTYSSSNKKVATVSKKGVVTTKKLGTTVIKVKYKNKTKKYTITVVPKKESDIYLSQTMAFGDQKAQIKVLSKKYDTSQIKLKAEKNNLNISKNAYFKGYTKKKCADDSITFYYGSYKIYEYFSVVSDVIITSEAWTEKMYAGEKINISFGEKLENDWFGFDLESALEKGAVILIDGQPYNKDKALTAGIHTITVTIGEQKVEKELTVAYPVAEALKNRDLTGYDGKDKEVLEKVLEIVDKSGIITEGMSEEAKVRAVHDYLIYNARYAVDYKTVKNKENYGAYGILINQSGVCQSYALSFQLIMAALDIPCRYIRGGNHAWNQVMVDGVWYYIDCTWDDPVGGNEQGNTSGHENYDYYLSQELWYDHVQNEVKDMKDIPMYRWERYYFDGEDY